MSNKTSDKTTFLYVEDNDHDVELVRHIFQDKDGIELYAVKDGKEAMDYLLGASAYQDRNQHPMPQVILLDLKMPRIDGFHFLDWLRNHTHEPLSRLPIIVMSTSSEQRDIDRAYKLGANAFLTKPID